MPLIEHPLSLYLVCRLGERREKNTGDLFGSQKCYISLLPKFSPSELNHMAPASCKRDWKMMSSVHLGGKENMISDHFSGSASTFKNYTNEQEKQHTFASKKNRC